MFGDEVQPDIDIQAIADELKPGYFTNGMICEGCGLNAIIKEENSEIQIGLIKEGQDQLEIVSYEDFMKLPMRF